MAKQQEVKLKWFHFLIYFVLWFNAFLLIVSGLGMLGAGDPNDYIAYPMLRTLELAYAAAYLFFGVFCIITRSRLAKFKKGAPKLLYAFYVLDLLLVFGITLGDLIVYGADPATIALTLSDPSMITSIASSVFMLALNCVYFKKRAHLFVN